MDGLWFDSLYDQNADLASLPSDPDAIYISKAGRAVRIASRDGGRSWSAHPAFSTKLMVQHPELGEITNFEASRDGVLWAGCGNSLCEFSSGTRSVRVWGERDGGGTADGRNSGARALEIVAAMGR